MPENITERTTLLRDLSFGLHRLHYERIKAEISADSDFPRKLYDATMSYQAGTIVEFPFSGTEIAAYLDLVAGPQIRASLAEGRKFVIEAQRVDSWRDAVASPELIAQTEQVRTETRTRMAGLGIPPNRAT